LDLSDTELSRRHHFRPGESFVMKKCLQLLSNNLRSEWMSCFLNLHATVDGPDVGLNTVLNRHIIRGEVKRIRWISAGGYGTVYEGYWNGKVAFKEMKGELERTTLELLKEATVSAALDHKNICKFLGVALQPDSPFIVYEYMPWCLFDLIHVPAFICSSRPRIRTPALRLRIVSHISRGIHYLHSISLIHADLKSANILVDDNNNSVTAKICDFGHAAVRTAPRPLRRIGTPHWAAPEALRREAISFPSDVWAFGVMCWEMLTFKIPFTGLSTGAVIASVGWGGSSPDDDEKRTCELGQLASNCFNTVAKRPLISDCVQRVHKIRMNAAPSTGCCVVLNLLELMAL